MRCAMWWLVLASVADAGTCAGACAKVLGCAGIINPLEVLMCQTSCEQGAPDLARLAAIEAANCEDALRAIQDPTFTPGATPAPPSDGSVEAAAPSPGTPAPPARGACGSPKTATADAQLHDLLVRTAWCSFHYANGATSTSRWVLSADGRAVAALGNESSFSGENRNYLGESTASWGAASQSSSGRDLCWKLEGRALHFAEHGGAWVPSATQVKDNGAGWPILVVDGTEYSSCN